MPAVVFPYKRLSSDLKLSVKSIRIDNITLPEYHINTVGEFISLYAVERRDWKIAEIEIEAEVSLQELKSNMLDDNKTKALFRINCDSTNFRCGTVSELVQGRAGALLTVTKAPLARSAILQCFIVREMEDGISRILKEADDWFIAMNEPQSREIGARRRGGLQEFAEIKWGVFTDPLFANGALIAFAKEAYYIDVTAESPTLYLNRGLENYETLLSDNAGASRAERAFKDLEFRRISLGVWLAFAYEALSGVSRDPESGELNQPDGWRAQVLSRLLPKLFPGETLDSAIAKVATLRANGTADTIAGRLQVAINEIVGSSATLRRQMPALVEA